MLLSLYNILAVQQDNTVYDRPITNTYEEGEGAGFWLPPEYSNFGDTVDVPFMFITYVGIFFFVLIVAVMLWFMWRYNRARGIKTDHTAHTHHTALEVTWSGIPLVLSILMFYVGFRGYMNMANPPKDAYTINSTAAKWFWTFTYPNGVISPHLHIPPDEDIKIVLTSTDVLHAFFVPDFRVKSDAVPGKYSYVWFNAQNKSGQPEAHRLFCAEFCGTDHSTMIADVVVHSSQEDFDHWLAVQGNYQGWGMTLVEAGDFLYQRRGCQGCHSVDGSPNTGPSFKNTYSAVTSGQRQIVGGKVDSDDFENYIATSLKNPQAEIVVEDGVTYPGNMPKVQLSPYDISAITAYLKWLETNDGHPYDDFVERQKEESQQ